MVVQCLLKLFKQFEAGFTDLTKCYMIMVGFDYFNL